MTPTRTFKRIATLAVAMLVSNQSHAAIAPAYEFHWLSSPGIQSIDAEAINASGTVAGTAYVDGKERAVLWTHGVATVLDGLGRDSAAFGVNSLGQAVGYSSPPGSALQAVLWDGSAPSVLSRPADAYLAIAVGINDAGQVAGTASSFSAIGRQPVRWDAGNVVLLDLLGGRSGVATGINNMGDVVGYIDGANGAGFRNPVIWHGSDATVLSSLLDTSCCNQASAINDAGQVVGWSSSRDGNVRAVVWDRGVVPVALDSLSAADHALGLNQRGQAVGMSNAGGFSSAALWDIDTGAGVDLNSFLSKAQRDAGWSLFSAAGINDAGDIVGVAYNAAVGGFTAYELTPVPEPGTVWLVLVGVIFIGLARRTS